MSARTLPSNAQAAAFGALIGAVLWLPFAAVLIPLFVLCKLLDSVKVPLWKAKPASIEPWMLPGGRKPVTGDKLREARWDE